VSVVQSSGQLVNVDRRTASFGNYAGGPLVPLGERFSDYGAIYRTQPAVRTVIDFLARNTAQIGLHLFQRAGDTDRQRVTGHPAADAVSRPNPWTTRYRLLYSLICDRAIYDFALWVKFKNEAGQVSLVRIPPSKVEFGGNSWVDPETFTISGTQGKVQLPRESVVYFHGYNPVDASTGSSPMETLRLVLAEEQESMTYRTSFFKNAARLEHVITRPRDAPKMSPEAKDRFWARWNAQYVGTSNAAKTALLEEGMSITPMSSSAKDSQYLEARKFNLEEIARFYHVPLPSIGILDNANYSNMESAHKQLYQDTLGPDLTEIQEELKAQLLPEFTGTEDFYFEFNIAEKLKGSFEEQAASLQTMVGGPVLTRNEGRARLNLPKLDGPEHDELIQPLNVTTGGQASPTDSAPETVR